MQRLCFCFRRGKCSCIVCEGEEQDPKEEKTRQPTLNYKKLEEVITTCRETCAKMANMDIHLNAPCIASSSSVRSTPIVELQPTLEDIQIAYQKLQSLMSDPIVRFPIPTQASAKCLSTFSQALGNTSNLDGYERQHSLGSYFTPNKIAYKEQVSIGSNTPTLLNSQDGPCLATLQNLIQKMKAKKTPPMQQECSMVDESTKRLMNKLRNLDEILQNLDNSLLYKKNYVKSFAPQLDGKHSITNQNLSNKSYPMSKHVSANSIRLLSTNARLTFTPPPLTSPTACSLESNAKPSTNLRGGTNLVVDKIRSEFSSSQSTQVPQSFATPITTRATEDVPLLLSNFASFRNESPKKLWNENKAMQKVVEMVAEQVEQQMLQHLQCLRRRPRSRQQKRCKMMPQKQSSIKLGKKLLSNFQQRLARTDMTLQVVKHQLDCVIKETNHKPKTNSLEKKSRDVKGTSQTIEFIKDSASLRRIVKTLEEKYSTLLVDNQQYGVRIEGIEKQCHEHSMELELCWAAINQLCIDNELFRNELLQQQGLNEKK